jgi:hypothetical protein
MSRIESIGKAGRYERNPLQLPRKDLLDPTLLSNPPLQLNSGLHGLPIYRAAKRPASNIQSLSCWWSAAVRTANESGQQPESENHEHANGYRLGDRKDKLPRPVLPPW